MLTYNVELRRTDRWSPKDDDVKACVLEMASNSSAAHTQK